MADAISLARELKNMWELAHALWHAGWLAHFERNPAEVERLASDLYEVSTRMNFEPFLQRAAVLRGWARSASGNTADGIAWIEDGIADYRASGSMLDIPFLLALKAEAFHLADRTGEALEAIKEAEAVVERFENQYWCAELQRLRGVFLAAMCADETQIEGSFQAAISIAKEQKSISLEKRAEATYAEYRRQKANGSERTRFRLPL
jgi:adenylate cyclase